MRNLLIVLLFALGAPSLTQAAALRTVPKVDLDRYAGVWFVIASYFEDKQAGCKGMKAVYTRTEDGFDLHDQCRKDGTLDTLNGNMTVMDEATNAKLRGRFYLIFTVDYWVIDLDPAYRWVVVGEPEREHVWIMSRGPFMDKPTMDGIKARLKAQGYDPTKLVAMPQP
ncbi:MAG: apolipoprotein D and lipocalin family protein [Bradymonadia bacterium]|jgi:apolipoprotein D and lipocalin family protein